MNDRIGTLPNGSSPIASAIVLGLLMAICGGCSRAHYRRQADQEVYALVDCAASDPRWPLEEFTIRPNPESRFSDPYDPDCPPMPPDDPTSHRLMQCVDGKRAWPHWHDHGDTSHVENPAWRIYLPYDEDKDGTKYVALNRDSAVETALLHSREYQQELEDLYLSALDVTLERFRFDAQFFGGNSTFYTADGRLRTGGASQSTLDVDTDLQMSRRLASGGELLVGAANSLVWQFSGSDSYAASTLLDFSLIQPLLRAGGRAVVLEQLTQSERNLLANIRQMERFRRSFYAQIVAGRQGSGLLNLLEEQVRIRNQENNVAGLRDSVELLDALFRKPPQQGRREIRLQVDQARQRLYRSQSSLLSSKMGLQEQLDAYKITLGLPPDLNVRIEDDLLQEHKLDLIDAALTKAQNEVASVLDPVRQTVDRLRAAAEAAEAAKSAQAAALAADAAAAATGAIAEVARATEAATQAVEAVGAGQAGDHARVAEAAAGAAKAAQTAVQAAIGAAPEAAAGAAEAAGNAAEAACMAAEASAEAVAEAAETAPENGTKAAAQAAATAVEAAARVAARGITAAGARSPVEEAQGAVEAAETAAKAAKAAAEAAQAIQAASPGGAARAAAQAAEATAEAAARAIHTAGTLPLAEVANVVVQAATEATEAATEAAEAAQAGDIAKAASSAAKAGAAAGKAAKAARSAEAMEAAAAATKAAEAAAEAIDAAAAGDLNKAAAAATEAAQTAADTVRVALTRDLAKAAEATKAARAARTARAAESAKRAAKAAEEAREAATEAVGAHQAGDHDRAAKAATKAAKAATRAAEFAIRGAEDASAAVRPGAVAEVAAKIVQAGAKAVGAAAKAAKVAAEAGNQAAQAASRAAKAAAASEADAKATGAANGAAAAVAAAARAAAQAAFDAGGDTGATQTGAEAAVTSAGLAAEAANVAALAADATTAAEAAAEAAKAAVLPTAPDVTKTAVEAMSDLPQATINLRDLVWGDCRSLQEALQTRVGQLEDLAKRREFQEGDVDRAVCNVDGLHRRIVELNIDLYGKQSDHVSRTAATLLKTRADREWFSQLVPGPGLAEQLDDTLKSLEDFRRESAKVTVAAGNDLEAWYTLLERLRELLTQLSDQLLSLSLRQAQARVDTVTLVPVELDSEEALQIARTHRRDWMNAQAELVNSWRQIEVAANDLRSGLDVTFKGDLSTTGNNPIRFRGPTGRLQVGLEFDAPLTRLAERNAYRETLIAYQRARRDYIAFEDSVSQSLRATLRDIRLNQLNFELQRSAVHVAIAQVELARIVLQASPDPGPTSARDLVDALTALLDVQNSLLRIWVDYQTQRMNLYLDLGTMELDPRGIWIDPDRILTTAANGPGEIEQIPPGIEVLPALELP